MRKCALWIAFLLNSLSLGFNWLAERLAAYAACKKPRPGCERCRRPTG